MLGELVPTGGGDPIPLLKTRLSIGRREECDICLRFPNVSSNHCELEFLNGYWRVRDLGSRNGVKVNGLRVDAAWLLPGDELGVAKHFYEVKYTARGDAPPPETDDILSVGLLQKAGLSKEPSRPRRPARESGEAQPATVAGPGAADRFEGLSAPEGAKPAKNKPDSDESIALKWLESTEADSP